MAKVRWGILSTARINRRIIPAIGESDRGELVAVASRSIEKASDYAQEWGIPRAYGSYEELLAAGDIDVIYIPLPNDLHAEWTIRALRAGKHVLCEKPFCMTLEELDNVRSVVEETGLHAVEAFMYLHHELTAFLTDIIHSGRLGELRRISSTFCFMFDRPRDNYRYSAGQGGGALWDVGVYPISFLQHILGKEPRDVKSHMHVVDGIDMSTWAQLQYEDDVVAQFFVSFNSAFSTHTIVHGTKGLLTFTHPFTNPNKCRVFIEIDDVNEEIEPPRVSLYAGEIEDMHDVILNGKTPRVSLDQTEGFIRTVLRLRSSSTRPA